MASFRESKAKIEAFLTNPRNLASILPDLCSERFLSKQEELEVSLTGQSRRAHTVTKILENKITSQPKLFVNLKKILQSHKFEEGGETDTDHDDSDLPLGMTTVLMDETSFPYTEKYISLQKSSLSADAEATKEQVQLQTAEDVSKLKPQALAPTLESAPSTKNIPKSSTDPLHSVVTHAATATTTHSVKSKTRKPRSRAIAGLDIHLVRENVYTRDQLRRLKEAEADYPGIDFSAYYSTVTIGSKGGVIRGEGIQLRIPPNATGRQQSRTISLRACIDGPFQLPGDIHLASPVFLVTCTPLGNFHRAVTLTLHHFVQLTSHEECEMMVLLTSPQTPTRNKHGQHWRFEISDNKPRCFQNFTHGEVEVSHFSFMCFGIRRTRGVHPCKENIDLCNCETSQTKSCVYYSLMQHQKTLLQTIFIEPALIHQYASAHLAVLFFSVSVFIMKCTRWLDWLWLNFNVCEHINFLIFRGCKI